MWFDLMPLHAGSVPLERQDATRKLLGWTCELRFAALPCCLTECERPEWVPNIIAGCTHTFAMFLLRMYIPLFDFS